MFQYSNRILRQVGISIVGYCSHNMTMFLGGLWENFWNFGVKKEKSHWVSVESTWAALLELGRVLRAMQMQREIWSLYQGCLLFWSKNLSFCCCFCLALPPSPLPHSLPPTSTCSWLAANKPQQSCLCSPLCTGVLGLGTDMYEFLSVRNLNLDPCAWAMWCFEWEWPHWLIYLQA